MGTLELLGWATGIGFLAGLRLYATVLALGLAVRFGLISLRTEFLQLEVLGNWWVIGVAAGAFLLEFFADKIPWVDSVWDAIHTFLRPLGAAALALATVGDVNPAFQVTLALVTGGVALTSHSMKAATRLAVNQSPEPVSNIVLSLAGDALVPLGVWAVLTHPLLVGAIVVVFLLVAAILIRKLWRALRRQMATLTLSLQPKATGRDRTIAADS